MNLYDSVRRFDTIPDRDRQTDGRVETSLTTKRRAMQSIERTKMNDDRLQPCRCVVGVNLTARGRRAADDGRRKEREKEGRGEGAERYDGSFEFVN